jgi:hypothetical protein
MNHRSHTVGRQAGPTDQATPHPTAATSQESSQ